MKQSLEKKKTSDNPGLTYNLALEVFGDKSFVDTNKEFLENGAIKESDIPYESDRSNK